MRTLALATFGSSFLALGVLLAGCTGLDGSVEDSIVNYAQQELGVEGVEVGDWKKGGECIAAEVTTEDDETYRVILVAQNLGPQPYEPLVVSQIYTLDDFVGSSDAWCGIIHTPAYVFDKDGARIIG